MLRRWLRGGLLLLTLLALAGAASAAIVSSPRLSPGPGLYTKPCSVTLSTATAGATLRYTLNGANPTATYGTVYTGPVAIASNKTLKVVAYKAGYSNSSVVSANYTFKVANLAFSPVAGVYTSAQSVKISTTTPGVTIRYTLNGATPTTSYGTVYTGPVTVSKTQTLKAVAYRSGWTTSNLALASYTITGTVATPKMSVAGGSYTTPQTVSLSCATTGATIRYTVNGTVPTTTNGSVYTGPIAVSGTRTIQARAYKTAWLPSAVATATYLYQVQPPVFSVPGGDYDEGLTVSLSTSTPGAYIRYTTDGSTPTGGNGTTYSGPITLPGTTTLKAFASRNGWTASEVFAETYVLPVSAPTFSVAGGVYEEDQWVQVLTTTPGASLRYTTDGSEPTETHGTLPPGGAVTVPVAADTTIRAIAFLEGSPSSVVTQASYDIERQFASYRIQYVIRGMLGIPTGPLPAGALASITDLTLNGVWWDNSPSNFNPIASLGGLEALTGLRRLWIESVGQLTDLSPLAGLSQLNEITIYGCQATDLTPLSGLSALQSLELTYGPLTDLTPLSGLSSLVRLGLSGNQIADAGPLAGLTGLTFLDLSGNRVSDLAPLSGLTSLTNLLLSDNRITGLGPLSGLTALRELNLENTWWENGQAPPMASWAPVPVNRVSDLAPLAGLAALETLALTANEVADLSPLAGMTSLQVLLLDYNLVTDLTPLAELATLSDLRAGANQISILTPLADLTALTRLYLWGNEIRDLIPLAGLTALTEMNLSSNQIDDVTPLAGLENLYDLIIVDNCIVDFSPVSFLPDLATCGVCSFGLWSNPQRESCEAP